MQIELERTKTEALRAEEERSQVVKREGEKAKRAANEAKRSQAEQVGVGCLFNFLFFGGRTRVGRGKETSFFF